MTDEMTQAETLPQLDASSLVDGERLEAEVKDMYRHVAREEEAELHFEVGRRLAEHLGYSPALLDAIPAEAVASFAGVGHHLDLAALQPGEAVLDLGSGSGTDIFCSAVLVGDSGRVVGVDITDAQLEKAARLRDRDGLSQVELVESRIEALPFDDATFDVVISNGVINLSLLKGKVFAEAARVLRPRWAAGDRRHRQRPGAEGAHAAQRRAVGCVHRGRDPAQQLHGGDRGAGPASQGGPAERVPVHLRAGAGRLQHLRGREHLAAGREAGLAWRRISGPGARAAGRFARVAEWRVPACMDVAGPP
jgi:SAM-dependent methyltransferase